MRKLLSFLFLMLVLLNLSACGSTSLATLQDTLKEAINLEEADGLYSVRSVPEKMGEPAQKIEIVLTAPINRDTFTDSILTIYNAVLATYSEEYWGSLEISLKDNTSTLVRCSTDFSGTLYYSPSYYGDLGDSLSEFGNNIYDDFQRSELLL